MTVAHSVNDVFPSALFYFVQTCFIVAGSVVSKDYSCSQYELIAYFTMPERLKLCFPILYFHVTQSSFVYLIKEQMI